MKKADIFKTWKDRHILIMGAGCTGLSCAKILLEYGIRTSVLDNSTQASGIEKIKKLSGGIKIYSGDFDFSLLDEADVLLVSPGISIRHPFIVAAKQKGKQVIGDVELFCRLVTAPIIAITGSNGKSTVTALLGEVLTQVGMEVRVGGNIGVPVLDLIQDSEPDCYVLELSSFQLETTASLHAHAAVILNVSEDHMDRYDCFEDYIQAKAVINKNAKHIIVNADDEQVVRLASHLPADRIIRFSMEASDSVGVYFNKNDAGLYIYGNKVMDAADITLKGRHNIANILTVFSLALTMEVDLKSIAGTIQKFKGLEHRSQVIAEYDGIVWVNDSKATNIGATQAALTGFNEYSIILIAGGQGKGQDFNILNESVQHLKNIILFGEDAGIIGKALQNCNNISQVKNLNQAVEMAHKMAVKGDMVLLSPACASFDQFENYQQRGKQFVEYVQDVIQS